MWVCGGRIKGSSSIPAISLSMIREGHNRRWICLIAGVVAGVGFAGGLIYRQHRSPVTEASAPGGAYCDNGIESGKAHEKSRLTTAAIASTATTNQAGWIPKINERTLPGAAPDGMIWIPGGQFWMGSTEERMTDTRPWHRVYVDGYWMDKTEVTNEEFARFVKSTGYVTIAERKPRREDYPQARPENLVAGSVVFSPPAYPVALDNHHRWWSYVPGASWRHPEGPNSDIKDRRNNPVVHIA